MSYSTNTKHHQYKAIPDDFHFLYRSFSKSRVIIHPIYLTSAKDNRLDANSTTCPFCEPPLFFFRQNGRIALNEDFKWLNPVFEAPRIKSIRVETSSILDLCVSRSPVLSSRKLSAKPEELLSMTKKNAEEVARRMRDTFLNSVRSKCRSTLCRKFHFASMHRDVLLRWREDYRRAVARDCARWNSPWRPSISRRCRNQCKIQRSVT